MVTSTGVCGRESCNQAAHSRPAPALRQSNSAGTSGDHPVSDDRSMALRFPIALVLSVICLAAPAWADYQAGVDAYNSGNYATALREWRPLAEQGDPRAQFRLGSLYENGSLTDRLQCTPVAWFTRESHAPRVCRTGGHNRAAETGGFPANHGLVFGEGRGHFISRVGGSPAGVQRVGC